MANIFVYSGVGIAASALPNRRALNLTRISCLPQEDERLATRLNELAAIFNMAVDLKLGFKLEVKLSIGLKLDFSVQI